MSIKDVIKSGVYENFAGGNLSASSALLILVFSAIIGIYIYVVYKQNCKAEFYSGDLNVTIAGMPVIIAAIMVAMQSNLIVSLGMVGALSIVRFRNAVKNPLDLLYLFWSISAGIICGVGLEILAAILCVIMTVLIPLLQLLPNAKGMSVLIVKTREDADWEAVNEVIFENCKYVKEKSSSYRSGETEVVYELKVIDKEELLKGLKAHKELAQINFFESNGEYHS